MPTRAPYDRIGIGYAQTRRADGRIAARIRRALEPAESVVNVGAGTGSYEPDDLEVIAVEPSKVMISQRPPHAAKAIVGEAETLPLPDDVADAAMTILSIHHWTDPAHGVAEMHRVARMRVVILTYALDRIYWWLHEYAPEIFDDDRRRFPRTEDILTWLQGGRIERVEIPADCSDLFLGALWARPELILDDRVRSAISGFARMDAAREQAAVEKLRADLSSGRWDEVHGGLRRLDSLDVGLRLIVADV
jgi:SAM-dependent methyltransferase